MSIGYRTHAEPSIVRRAAEVWPEGVEQMPYATSWTPLYPFPGSPVTGGAALGSGAPTAAQTSSECNLEFVRGDSVNLAFFFPGVIWTTEDPGGTLPVPWQQRVWNAQIRDPNHHPADPCCYINAWIPMWGGLPTNAQIAHISSWTLLTEFMCTATYIDGVADVTYGTFGTQVTIELDSTVAGSTSQIYPDTYKWDLQMGTEYVIDAETDEIIEVLNPTTLLQGDVIVHPDYTYSAQVPSL